MVFRRENSPEDGIGTRGSGAPAGVWRVWRCGQAEAAAPSADELLTTARGGGVRVCAYAGDNASDQRNTRDASERQDLRAVLAKAAGREGIGLCEHLRHVQKDERCEQSADATGEAGVARAQALAHRGDVSRQHS